MIPLVKPFIAPREELMPEIERVLYSGYIASGREVVKFEDLLKTALDNKKCLALNSGSAALHIAFVLLGLGVGDEVISTAMTAEPTNTTIAQTGAKIVWGDIDPRTGLLDPDSVESKITTKTKAIVLVHYAGMVCDMKEFDRISKKYQIPIIEDAAHALGSGFGNSITGSCDYSAFTCFSFQAIKHFTTVDGGAITMKSQDNCEEAARLRWFGLDKAKSRLENDITRIGYKYAMNNVNAVIGSVQGKYINQILCRSIANGQYYDKAFSSLPGITVPLYTKESKPSYWLYTLLVEDRENFIRLLKTGDVEASPLHHRNDTHSVFSASRCDLPGLDAFYSSFVHIPCGWWVDDASREKIVSLIKSGW